MNSRSASQAPDPAAGLRRIADPRILFAPSSGLLLGTAIAAAAGPIAWSWLTLTVVSIFAFEIAKNACSELFDFESSAERGEGSGDWSPFSGRRCVLFDGLLTGEQTALIAAWFYGMAILAALLIFVLRERAVMWLGLAGAALAYAYRAPPLRLSARGLGELAVAIAYGPIITSGAYLVQRGEVPLRVVLASIPLGLLVAAILWIHEVPDAEADRAAGKQTRVVRMGTRGASRGFAAIVLGAFAFAAILPLMGVDRGVWTGVIGLPLGLRASRRLLRAPDDADRIRPAQVWTLWALVLYAIGAGVGVLLL